MIISNEHKFVFVHIPKCAGSSVRKQLESIDGIDSSFAGIVDHPVLGQIDLTHLPLSVLRDHFFDTFKKIQHYQSFAVLRDPYERFPSSMFQRLRMYGTKPVEVMNRREFSAAVDRTIEILCGKRANELLPYDLIHFQKQRTFVYVDNTQFTQTLVPLGDVRLLFKQLGEIVHAPFEEQLTREKFHENKSESFESDIAARVAAHLLPLYNDAVKKRMPAGLRTMLRQRFLVDLSTKFEDVLKSNHVRQFVGEYYFDDIELFERVNAK